MIVIQRQKLTFIDHDVCIIRNFIVAVEVRAYKKASSKRKLSRYIYWLGFINRLWFVCHNVEVKHVAVSRHYPVRVGCSIPFDVRISTIQSTCFYRDATRNEFHIQNCSHRVEYRLGKGVIIVTGGRISLRDSVGSFVNVLVDWQITVDG